MIMKQYTFSFIAAILIMIGHITLTSCRGSIEDMADGLVNGIADQIAVLEDHPAFEMRIIPAAFCNRIQDLTVRDLAVSIDGDHSCTRLSSFSLTASIASCLKL